MGQASIGIELSSIQPLMLLARLASTLIGSTPSLAASATPGHAAGCSTVRAARVGFNPVQTSPWLVLRLATRVAPEQVGRPVVALNGCSRGAGRRFWKATTWT